MTIREAATLLGVPYGRVYHAVRRRRVPATHTWAGYDVPASSVDDLRALWEAEDLIAATKRLIADAKACAARREQDAERARRQRLIDAERRARAAESVRRTEAKEWEAWEARRIGDNARFAKTTDAGEYARATIMAAEDRRGRAILQHLTLYPGYDPAGRVTPDHVKDLPTFIRGLDR